MSAALVEVTQADAATLESLRAGLQPFAHKSLGSLRIGMDEVRAVLSAISTIQSLTTRIAELEAENGRLRECLRSIKIEASRETGSWAHLKRCIAVQARATLTETSDDR